jgi:hypothetical protein
MALFEGENKKFLWGLGIGLIAAVVVREVLPSFKSVGRPLAKATVKSGITLLERSKETLAEWGEVFEDLVVEAKAELEEEAKVKAAAPAAVPPAPTEGKPN